jgi:hypothetical protein
MPSTRGSARGLVQAHAVLAVLKYLQTKVDELEQAHSDLRALPRQRCVR